MEIVPWHTGLLPVSAAHRCLNIVELQHKIFDFVLGSNLRDPVGRASLASIARTSRVFYSCAMEILWARLHSLRPLVQSLPADLWKLENKRLKFQRHMSVRDWMVFFHYAWRVRSLTISKETKWKESLSLFDPDVLRALTFPPTFGCVFPRLASLHWECTNRETLSVLRMFLSDRLTTLTLRLPGMNLDVSSQSFLASLGALCPNLKRLSVSGYGIDRFALDTAVSDCILDLVYLETLTCGTLSEMAIAHIARLRLPLVLSFDFPGVPLSPQVLQLFRYPAWSTVKRLSISAPAPTSLMPLTQTLYIAPRCLDFTFLNGEPCDTLQEFFGGLTRCCYQKSIEEFSVIYTTTTHISRNSHFTINTIRPLLLLTNLQSLTLVTGSTMRLDNKAIKEMAQCWPLLRTLDINVNTWRGTRVSTKGLIHLLKHCPQLQSLSIVIDFSPVDLFTVPTKAPAHGFSHKNLQFAYFGQSIIKHPLAITAFLTALMPNLSYVEAWDLQGRATEEDQTLYSDRWAEVHSLLVAFHAIRKQGRRLGKQKIGNDVDTDESESESDGSSVEGQPQDQPEEDPDEAGPAETVDQEEGNGEANDASESETEDIVAEGSDEEIAEDEEEDEEEEEVPHIEAPICHHA
ncbi:hypothetical protein BJ138DRAFT_1146819 [Hygrophoropsis aurantiaca]|uniref:Uncharacterized protein n=1 Tax=Hygrophoropsis aurantiaca TaxID=72124 RepID=A0ACB8AIR3_9AGAM|nr:hypothetical protein BJ138DRAFT_1146819 [Hygrophoropsis aurantiaca]